MKVLALVTDAFGGTGGIAQYNRDLIAAFACHSSRPELTVVPRVIARETQPIPERVTHRSDAARSKVRYVATVLELAGSRPAFDWIVCGHVNLLPLAHAASFLSRAPIILLTYGMEVWEPTGLFGASMIARTSAITSISEFTLGKLREWSGNKLPQAFLLPNAIDLAAYTPGRRDPARLEAMRITGSPVLLTVGRMDVNERAKGFDEILAVLPRLLPEYPTLRYVAVGDGTDLPRLRAKARDLGVADSVTFTGYLNEEDKLTCYRGADVFVMPSRLEGFGYVFLEALAVGLPVIASKVDGSREAVRNGAWGALVDPAQPEELVTAIRSTLRNPVVPARSELEYFSRSAFEARCHRMFDALFDERRATVAIPA